MPARGMPNQLLDLKSSAMHILARHEGRGLWLGTEPPRLPPDRLGVRLVDPESYFGVVVPALWAAGNN